MKWWQIAGLFFLTGGAVYLMMRISDSGIDKIKKHEALRLKPYRDAGGKWTIGYGHLLTPGEWYDSISPEQADALLKQDLGVAEQGVKKYVTVTLSSNQYDALVSFVYNIGIAAFRQSTMLKKLNAGDYAGAAQEFERWKYVDQKIIPGLLARRRREKQTFLMA